jgi:hypothetical protein
MVCATQAGRQRVAGSVVGDERHVADLHDEVGRGRGQQFGPGVVRAGAQGQRDAVRAVGMDDAAGGGVERGGCRIDLAVQREGLAGAVAAGLLPVGIDAGQARGVEKAQAGVGRRDQEAAAG